jgi:hypothetical protein
MSIVHRRRRLLIIRPIIPSCALLPVGTIGVLCRVEGEVVLGQLAVFSAFVVGYQPLFSYISFCMHLLEV